MLSNPNMEMALHNSLMVPKVVNRVSLKEPILSIHSPMRVLSLDHNRNSKSMVMMQAKIKVKDKLRMLKQSLVQGMVALKEVQTSGAEAQTNREPQRTQQTPRHSEVT